MTEERALLAVDGIGYATGGLWTVAAEPLDDGGASFARGGRYRYATGGLWTVAAEPLDDGGSRRF